MDPLQITLPNGLTYHQPVGLFIANQFVPSKGGDVIETFNPYTGAIITTVQSASSADVDLAVAAAESALPSWKTVPPPTRGRLLHTLADLIERDANILAAIEAADNGKAFQLAKAVDLVGTIDTLRYFAGWADKQFGQTVEMGPNSFNYTRHEPIGVVGQIIPWNFPLLIWAWKIAPAIACGNVCVLKSAEQTPLSALYVANLVREAGFPPGVINIISGLGKEAGAALASHPRVRKLAFTGSTAVGRQILKAAAETNLKRVTLELGGKSPHIVFADADFAKAIEAVSSGIFFNHGQNCCAGARAYVHESIYERFLTALSAKVAQIKVGDPFAEDTFQGPQVSQVQYDRIMTLIEAGKSTAKLLVGGNQHSLGGLFVQPTIFADVSEQSPLSEEIFGPVL